MYSSCFPFTVVWLSRFFFFFKLLNFLRNLSRSTKSKIFTIWSFSKIVWGPLFKTMPVGHVCNDHMAGKELAKNIKVIYAVLISKGVTHPGTTDLRSKSQTHSGVTTVVHT